MKQTHTDSPRAYKVVRTYKNRPGVRRTIISRCTLEEAQAHCRDLNTSSSTAWTTSALKRTKRYGPWFDGYEER